MRPQALGLGGVLVLAVCGASSESAAAESEPPDDGRTAVLVDLDAGPGDLDALRTLLGDDGVRVAAVSVSSTAGCDNGRDAVEGVLADTGVEDVPIACGADEVDDDVLDTVDRMLVLGPLTDAAALLQRLPTAPITVAVNRDEFAADPGAARQVIEQRTVTVVADAAGSDLSAEEVAAWLIIDETVGRFVVEQVEITSSGEVVIVDDGATVRRLNSVDLQRLATPAGEDPPAQDAALVMPELRWRTDIGYQVYGSHKRAAIAGDLVIVGGVDGQVHGISLATGELVWTVDTGTDGAAATGVAFEDGVAVLSAGVQDPLPMGSDLVAIDVGDRSVRWTFDPQTVSPDSAEVSSPAIADGLVYAGTGVGPALESATGIIFALDLHSGEPVWLSDGNGGPSEPLVAGDDLVVGGVDGTLRVLDRHTGALRWERDIVVAGNGIASRPLVADGAVYVTGDDGSVNALDQESGEILWRFQETTGVIPASPVLADGRLIVAELFGGTTRALDPATGEELWATREAEVLGDPVVVDETVIVTNFDGPGRVVGLAVTSGELLWEFDNPTAIDGSPVVADGVLVYQAGDVYALDLP